MDLAQILALDEGPERTVALVAWVQGLFGPEEATPVLVGGAAVEVYTSGAHVTGDVDLVGTMTAREARALEDAGFERHGRHWIHEAAQVYIEFPGSALDADEEACWLRTQGERILIISVEDLLVDRLGAWEYWRSSVDGVNAFLLFRAQDQRIDFPRLKRRVTQAGWIAAWRALTIIADRWGPEGPPRDELERWANAGP